MAEDFVYYPSKGKRVGKIIGLIILVLITLFIAVVAVACLTGCSANDNMKNKITAYKPANIVALRNDNPNNNTGYATIQTTDKDKKELNVLQLTDIHIGYGILCMHKDRLAVEAVKKIVADQKPDLIIFTGDMIYPIPIQAGNLNNAKATKFFGDIVDQFDIPWTVTFGNHDTELYAMSSKKDISTIYKTCNNGKWKNCLYYEGSDNDVFGDSNHIINFLNYDGSLNTSLVMVDSNMYVNGNFTTKYDMIHKNQSDWYTNNMKKLTVKYNNEVSSIDQVNRENIVKSLAFFHIPVTEYRTAWDLYNNNKKNVDTDYVKYGTGGVQEKGGVISDPLKKDGPFYDDMLKLGSCKAMFVGHDHENDFTLQYNKHPEIYKPVKTDEEPAIDSGDYKFEYKIDSSKFDNGGIWLCYGKSIDYLAYIGIINKYEQRGGNMITINEKGDFTYTQTLLTAMK